MILELLRQDGLNPKRKATTQGGEYCSPCPGCGGVDRFVSWPHKKSGNTWMCRQCTPTGGDEIDYLQNFHNLTYREACKVVGKPIQNEKTKLPSQQLDWKPKEANIPSKLWCEKAMAFIDWANKNLEKNNTQLKWLQSERGLSLVTIQAQKLGWNPKDIYRSSENWGVPEREKDILIPRGLVIPVYVNGVINRVKTRSENRNPKYLPIAGGGISPMILGQEETDYVMIVESELDAIFVDQETGDLFTIIAMGSASYRPDIHTDSILQRAQLILVSFDTDTTGGENSWKWWRSHYKQWKRWPSINGKDPTLSFLSGVNIRVWAQAGLQGYIPDEAYGFFDYLHENEITFPEEWLSKFDETTLERLAIMTVDGGLTDESALEELKSLKKDNSIENLSNRCH